MRDDAIHCGDILFAVESDRNFSALSADIFRKIADRLSSEGKGTDALIARRMADTVEIASPALVVYAGMRAGFTKFFRA